MAAHSEPLLNRHRYTRAQYHAMGEAGIFGEDDRVELIDGEIIDMVPIGCSHSGTINWLTAKLVRAVGDSAIVSVQNPVVLDDWSEPQPDLVVLRYRADFYTTETPRPGDVLLLIEVAASSLKYDRDFKLPFYARHGIRETWLFDLEARAVTRHFDPTAAGYAREVRIDGVRDLRIPGLDATIDLIELWG